MSLRTPSLANGTTRRGHGRGRGRGRNSERDRVLRARALAIGALACATLASSCNGTPLQRLRNATYPPDFHYITRGEIRGTMQGLASELYALDEILTKDGGPRDRDQQAVIEILTRMRELSSNLKQREHSNHPRVEAFAPRLRHNIVRALGGARELPPNYYFAGRVAGSCAYCHAADATRTVTIPERGSSPPAS